jgi:DNA-binding LacI/PurR family transcriptional regulator
MKVTVHEVARTADVSVGTVSRVLRGDPTVGPEFVERVKQASLKLNYRPLRRRAEGKNGSGTAEVSLMGRAIALVTLGLDRSLATLPVVAMSLHGTESAIARAGGSMLFADAPDLDRIPPVLEHERVSGVILKGPLHGEADWSASTVLLDRLRSLPCVWIFGRPVGAWGDSVGVNEFEVGRLAAEDLLSRGHRRVAFLNPKPDHLLFGRRQASFTHHMRLGGAEVMEFLGDHPEQWRLPLRALTNVESVDELVDQLMSTDPARRPTAVFTPADSIAALVYRSLAGRGLQVGRDISVISVNDERAIIDGLYPALTTISVRPEVVGRRAVDQLIQRLEGDRSEPPVEVSVEPLLVEGKSVRTI